MKRPRHKAPPQPLDKGQLERLAIAYVGRYATTRAKLRLYLRRKLRERGWEEEEDAAVDALVDRLTELGFIDDAAFALARAASLQRRGLGARRLRPALQAAGIEEEDAAAAHAEAADHAWSSALRFAERKRIGPFAAERPDRQQRDRQFAMMMRAGHPVEIARRLLDSGPGEIPEVHEL